MNFLLILLVLIFNVNGNNEKFTNPWVWFCNTKGNKCQRELKIQISNQTTFNSLELCRLVCGKYAGLWPKPTYSTKLSKDLIQIHPKNIKFINLNIPEDTNNLLKEMQNIFMENSNLKYTTCEYTENVVKINFDFNETDLINLNPKINENYELKIFTEIPIVYVNISAENIFGIRHGLETLSQLIAVNTTSNYNILSMISQGLIKDGPKFHHRGLLIDTSRHYLKLSTIKKQIDGLRMNKMNVLHWHVTDSHSFPMLLPNVPQLAQYGAYSNDKVYTLNDIEEIIKYGKTRGVRIILEIDTPSHAGNGWQFGEFEIEKNLGELATCLNYFPYNLYCLQPPCGQINPMNDNVYVILEKLFRDIGKVYENKEYFHLGGDEVSIGCWKTNKDVFNYIKNLNVSDTRMGYLTLWAKYQNKIVNIYNKTITNGNQKVIIWSSGLTSYKTANKFLDKNK
ncbi:chitooligosaccharidolytic beta-N-acetylglucosaminidase-like [Onthophagus taurus]|uniref:chitooligosaccharidolytic beta-N-acetylglucosaminidase-like n=1 Tax=Onthophagus taurus TaxID=166361 RepID=UPI0039BDF207